jgi:hypothetical protein
MTLGFEDAMSYPVTRVWSQPNAETFSIPPIAQFIQRWWRGPSVDPFARNSQLATYRNDLSPDTLAQYHMDAEEFCDHLADKGVHAQLVLFDPPYSPRQISEVYQSVGRVVTMADTQNSVLYERVKRAADRLLEPGGIALSFGWNSSGFGKSFGYEIVEIMLVCHGAAHNDTICVAQRKGARSWR